METTNFVSHVDPNQVPVGKRKSSREREELILENLEYVRQICGTMAVRLPDSVDIENLQSAAVVGLIEAADSFDKDRGVAFTTYAYPRIRGAIVDEIRRNSPLSQRVMKLISIVRNAMDMMEPPVMPEAIVEKTGLTQAEVDEAIDAMRLATTQRLDQVQELGETASYQTPDSALELAELKSSLVDAIRRLPDRERVVLSMYYMDEMRLKEIGGVLGLSESRVCRILSKAEFRVQQYCNVNRD